MNNQKRRSVRLIFLLLAVTTGLTTYSTSGGAQAAAPVIERFDVESEDRLVVGSRLRFTIEGSPGAVASVRINGIKQRIPLKEVEEGVYEGAYTVKAGDRIIAGSSARATLKKGNRSSSTILQQSLGVTDALTGNIPGVLPTGIQSFSATPIEKIEPGADIEFTLVGTPGGQASVSIEGLAGSVPLREVKSGRYQGGYTIRRADKIPDSARASGTLIANGRTLRTGLIQSLTSVSRALIRNLSPRDGETVATGGQTSISGSFDDSSRAGIDPKSVKLMVSGVDVTRNTVVTPQFFNYQTELRSGTHTAVITAKDYAGNPLSQSWTFMVSDQAGTTGGAASALPLEILSHQNNTEIGTGVSTIRGRTAPDAMIDVQVVSVIPVFGMFGYSQKQQGQTTRADASGNFAFNLQPQTVTQGTRYEVTLTASKNGVSQISNLTLLQKP